MADDKMKNMFESIRKGLNNPKFSNETVLYKNCLRTKVGNSYLGRIVPYMKNLEKTFVSYFNHSFKSYSTGQFIDEICLSTIGERCPICEMRFKLYKEDPTKYKDLTYKIKRKEQHLVNFYVLEDPTTKENIGTVKILKYAEQIHKKFNSAMEGDEVKELGERIYNFSPTGCNFRIKVESVSDVKTNNKYVTYVESAFKFPSKIDGMTEDKMQNIYDSAYDLESFLTCKPSSVLSKIVEEHILGGSKMIPPSQDSHKSSEPEQKASDKSTDRLDMSAPKSNNLPPLEEEAIEPSVGDAHSDDPPESEDEAAIRKMIEGLENIG